MGMFNWFGRTTLNARVWMVMLTVVAGLVGLTVISGIEGRDVQMTALGDSLQQQVESAVAIADDYRARATKGEMTDADAHKAALREIQAMRWNDGTGYVFAFDSDVKLLMHPLRGSDIGKSIRDDADAKGFHHYAAMTTADLKDGHAMTRYVQLIPKTNEKKAKISYSQWYKPWNMHFATGAYFDQIDAAFHAQLIRSLLRAGGIAFAVVLMVWLSMRSIKATIGGEPSRAVQIATRIADGDLRAEASLTFPEGSLLDALYRMRGRLADIVAEVQRSAGMVTLNSQQLAQGNDDLSQRTQEQASSLEETAASMEEMTATVKQNAENAMQADQLPRAAREQAERGGAVADEVMQAMANIGDSSRKIAEIVGLIDEIAFQTNLLALNAAVEAARAGEQGRGFAVVATEVRNLAQRSAGAAKEIKGLINDSANKVKAGSELVDQSGKALAEIVDSVKKVIDIVAEIAAASQEQSAGIDQVNHAVLQMDEMTQQNAALVEESAAAARAMQEQATELTRQVGFFQLG